MHSENINKLQVKYLFNFGYYQILYFITSNIFNNFISKNKNIKIWKAINYIFSFFKKIYLFNIDFLIILKKLFLKNIY